MNSGHQSFEKQTEPGIVAGCVATQVPTEFGLFLVEELTLSLDDFTLAGHIANHTTRPWRWASFLLKMRDPQGQPIVHDDRFDGHFYLKDIGRNATKPIASVDGRPPRLLLRPSILPASIEAIFIPERSYFNSEYKFSLVYPPGSDHLTYRDDVLKIAFDVTQTEVRFSLSNCLPEPFSLDWEKVSYIDLFGNKHRVIHRGVPLAQKDKKQATTVLDAGKSIDEMVYPADLVAGSRVFEDWRYNPVLPLSQYAPDYRLHTFSLFLPVEFSGTIKSYLFTIRIDNVRID